VEAWLQRSFHGEMSYMERNKEKRYDPRQLVKNTKTIVTVLQNYFPPEKQDENSGYKISKYAYGMDYHLMIREKLGAIVAHLEQFTGPLETRVFTDSAPVLDRAWAAKSGLGFIGKNTCLIHPRKGSFFFIGHIFLPVEAEYQANPVTEYCGTCTRCIDACPTGALVDAHQLDARKCISYLTIEYRGKLPQELKPQFDNWIFGCDICQDVCPWNRFSKPHSEPLFSIGNQLRDMKKADWESLEKPTFDKLFKLSAVKRTGYKGLKRNIAFLKDSDQKQ
jgi:epoxyqueuosine reductase